LRLSQKQELLNSVVGKVTVSMFTPTSDFSFWVKATIHFYY